MVDITQKQFSLRKAIASATLTVSSPETIRIIEQGKVPKGNVFEFSRAAGLLAIKNTFQAIPDCHPIPIEYSGITHRIDGNKIIITVEVHTIYKTGVEVEAMHGASVTALTMYDMLKPIDKQIEIQSIQLLSKTGGKTDNQVKLPDNFNCAVVVCSDSINKGESTDSTGSAVMEKLAIYSINHTELHIIPDETEKIQSLTQALVEHKKNLIVFCGGTGVSPRDVTPESLKPLLDKELEGVMETARAFGQLRTPYAMLSRGIAGFIQDTLILTLPGSVKGACETIDAVFPAVLHVFDIRKGKRHD
jgi:molybdenum cofactor biosynthesis protein MoaC